MPKKLEPTPSEYLRNLADRLMRVPVMYGTNQYDVAKLYQLAKEWEDGPCTTQ